MTRHSAAPPRRHWPPTRRVVILSLAVLVLVLGVRQGAWAGPPTDTLRGVFADANRVLVEGAAEGSVMDRITTLFDSVFDFQDAAGRALGGQWQARTSAEQDEFTRLFASLVERSYIHRMASGADVSTGVDIRYLGESVDEDTATVQAAIARKGGGDMILEHRMVQRSGHWMVRDVVIGGVSVVANYGAQFRRIMRDSSYRGLVARMKAKAGASARPDDGTGTEPLGRASFGDGLPPASSPDPSGSDHAVTTRLRSTPAGRPQAP